MFEISFYRNHGITIIFIVDAMQPFCVVLKILSCKANPSNGERRNGISSFYKEWKGDEPAMKDMAANDLGYRRLA